VACAALRGAFGEADAQLNASGIEVQVRRGGGHAGPAGAPRRVPARRLGALLLRPGPAHCLPALPQDSGSTAVVSYLAGDVLSTAWVGDSRAVLGSSGPKGALHLAPAALLKLLRSSP
jgi:hypothetical protein